MDEDCTSSSLIHFKLLPLVLKLLSVKFRRMSNFISVLFIMILAKLKLKSIKIQPLEKSQFKNLIRTSELLLNYKGDIYSCALVSLKTLIALSIRHTAWIQITKHLSENISDSENETNFNWKIKLPSVKDDHSDKMNSYYLQCLCSYNVPEDFTLYVTNEKLFNISKMGSLENEYSDLIYDVMIQDVNINVLPALATSATISGIFSACNIVPKDLEYILNCYFRKPRFLRRGDVFKVKLKKFVKNLESPSFNAPFIYFKVIKLSGNPPHNQLYFITKEYCSLYLDPPVHSYLPQVRNLYIESNDVNYGKVISSCPDGLHKQFNTLQRLFRLFLAGNEFDLRPIFLLSGPDGGGQDIVVRTVTDYFGLHLIVADCFDFYGLTPSLTEGKLNQLFTRVRITLPCVVYLKNVELLGREQNQGENPRLVDIFLTKINELWERKPFSYSLIIIGSTSSKKLEIVPAIARLFIYVVTFEVLKFDDSLKTLKWLINERGMSCSPDVLNSVCKRCKSYVYGDFVLLLKHTLRLWLSDKDLNVCYECEFTHKHFDEALEIMDAAYSDAIGAAKVPSVKWEDIGGLGDLKKEIMLTLNMPLKHPELFNAGLKRSGIMFFGPPGTGKTLMAKAIATECNYNFLSVKGPELMNMYVGESERNVREVFQRAREAAPCIIFFDELDSLAPCRGKSGDSGGVSDRVVSQLLTEMDGFEENKDVFVLGATNRPDLVDPALLRPGRFDKMFYVGICSDNDSKCSVLKALTRKFLLGPDIDLEKIAKELPNDISGADLYSVSANAWFAAARKAVDSIKKGEKVALPLVVNACDFESAINEFVPSLTAQDILFYKSMKNSGGR